MSEFASKWDSPCHLDESVSYRQWIMAQRAAGRTQIAIAEELGSGYTRCMVKNVEAHSTPGGLSLDAVLEAVQSDPSDRELLRRAAMNPPVVIGDATMEVQRLHDENAELRRKLSWALHAAPEDYQGGKMTIAVSDIHWGDRAHMPKSFESVSAKLCDVIDQYDPEELVLILNGDAIAGRGIYKEQHMDSTFTSTVDQVHLGVAKLYDLYHRLQCSAPQAKLKIVVLSGNHDRNMGEPTAPLFVAASRAMGLPAVFAGNEHIENAACEGVYNIYFEHGFGHSDLSPSSPKYISAMKDKFIFLSETHFGERRIRRFSHGHTHWYQLNTERVLGVFFDTTGGFQRNERVLLGKNVRPMGICIYVSPKGYHGVLDPLGVQPDTAIQRAEIANPFLMQDNMRDGADYLQRYETLAQQHGLAISTVAGVTPGGR